MDETKIPTAPVAELNAGPKLDAAVAERVMGWRWHRGRDWDEDRGWQQYRALFQPGLSDPAWPLADGTEVVDVRAGQALPRYSTDIAAAFDVVSEIEGPGCDLDILSLSHKAGADYPFDRIRWVAEFRRSHAIGYGDAAPEAICRAALAACAADD